MLDEPPIDRTFPHPKRLASGLGRAASHAHQDSCGSSIPDILVAELGALEPPTTSGCLHLAANAKHRIDRRNGHLAI
ncbi:MAG: hypothetical protein ACJA2W_000059 [Planctomycetota bacterium]|jgi:hypothetical protein